MGASNGRDLEFPIHFSVFTPACEALWPAFLTRLPCGEVFVPLSLSLQCPALPSIRFQVET